MHDHDTRAEDLCYCEKYLLRLLDKYCGIEGINPKYFLVRNAA